MRSLPHGMAALLISGTVLLHPSDACAQQDAQTPAQRPGPCAASTLITKNGVITSTRCPLAGIDAAHVILVSNDREHVFKLAEKTRFYVRGVPVKSWEDLAHAELVSVGIRGEDSTALWVDEPIDLSERNMFVGKFKAMVQDFPEPKPRNK